MFCNKCGYNNPPENTYCANCGEQLINNMSENNSNNNSININKSSIRMALKKEAKACKKGKLIAFTIIASWMLADISLLFNFIFFGSTSFILDVAKSNNIFIQIISLIVNSLLGSFVGLVLTFASLKILRNQEFTIGTIFKDVFSKMKYVLIIGLVYMLGNFYQLKMFSSSTLLIMMLIILIAAIYIVPVLSIMMHICADNEYQKGSIKDVIKDSFRLIKGHRIEYFGMIFSFLGTVILSALVLFIPMVWIVPYMYLSTANFYRYIKGEKQITESYKGISNITIVILSVLCFIAFFGLLVVFVVQGSLSNLKEAKTKSFADDAKNIVSVVENDYIVKGELGNSTYDINAINALLERKLDTSPFGNKYQHANVIIITDEDTHEYKYHICLDDGKYVIDTYKDYIDEYSVNEINSSSEVCG